MRIVIEKDDTINQNFANWLIRFIKVNILKELNNKNLNRINEYMNDNDIFDIGEEINIRRIIIQSLYTLNFMESGNYYIVGFNELTPLYNTKYRLIDVINFISYGNFEIRGCQIISNIFDSIQHNLKLYKKLYRNGYRI